MALADETALPPIPNGWFGVCWSKDLRVGDVQRIDYFEKELVLFRTRSGQAKVLDAHCPHLGAHLGVQGRVIGETIACPFHGWCFDGNGDCVDIPYCDEIPSRATLGSWPVTECNEMIFVWHHLEGSLPNWDVPVFPEFKDPDYSEPKLWEFETPVCIQDMAENSCDPVHFRYVHTQNSIPQSTVSIADDGRIMHMEAEIQSDFAMEGIQPRLVTDSYGLGLVSVRMEGIPDAGLLMFLSSVSITESRTLTRWVLTVSNNMVDLVGEDFMRGLISGVADDFHIWDNKLHRQRPVFCKADESLMTFRNWVTQFYSQ